MKKPVVLALVARHHKTKAISVLALTQEYTFKVLPRARGARTGPTIEVLAKEHAIVSVPRLPVDSLTVVYGENGEGKTTLLLDVCRTMAPYVGDRPLGIIWRDESGAVRLERGIQQESLSLSEQPTPGDSGAFKEGFRSVFYTTSPFESARRRVLVADGTIDATPSFGTNSFNGTSLCLAAGSLPKDIPFIRSVRVRLEFVEHLDFDDALEKVFATAYGLDIARPASTGLERTPEQMALITDAATGLSPRNKSLLAIEMHRARLDGPKQAEELLLDLLKFSSRRPGNQAVGRLLSARQSRLKWRLSARHIQRALEELKKLAVVDAPKELHAFADLLRDQPGMLVSGLQEAENLGLLRWAFLELSSGQVALLMLFASLSASLESLRSKGTRSVMIVIDEGEMFMHPAWQRKYLQDLMVFIEHFRKHFDELHLILATHSLIVAGDAPPNRLFDVKSGEMRNGFAFGPKEVLTDVYGVEEFAGNMSETLYDKIVAFLRGTEQPVAAREEEVRSLIEQIASPQLRTYLLEELQRRRQRLNA